MWRKIFVLYAWLVIAGSLMAQQKERPVIWGIAKMTFLISDIELARDYYSDFLGFEEAFLYPSSLGVVTSFKVNDRQFIEFIVDKHVHDKKGLVSVSLEIDSIENMRYYLQSKGIDVPPCTQDGAGNKVFVVQDGAGNNIEFIEFGLNGLHKKSEGKFLSNTRISKRIHHVGLYTPKIEEPDLFWEKILQCQEIVRYPINKRQSCVIRYLSLGDCTECIEHYSPCDENFAHPCFLVEDMQETIYSLKQRKQRQKLNKPSIGKTKRWLLNLLNPDGMKVEFTEAYCIK